MMRITYSRLMIQLISHSFPALNPYLPALCEIPGVSYQAWIIQFKMQNNKTRLMTILCLIPSVIQKMAWFLMAKTSFRCLDWPHWTLDSMESTHMYQASHTGVRRSVTPRLALETETQHRHGFEETARGLPGE